MVKYPGSFTVRAETFKAVLFDIFSSLKDWGFSSVFIVNSHGDQKHTKVIEQSIEEVQKNLDMKVYFMSNLDIPIDSRPVFPPRRENSFEPDVHDGSIETAMMWALYHQKVNKKIALELKPQKGFDPLAYCGDPASFIKERSP